MRHDITHALRGFRKAPVFTAVAIVSLTLAIGANTAIFSLLNALVLRELPVRDPKSLVHVSSIAQNSTYEAGVTLPMYREFLRRQTTFSAVIGWLGNGVMNVEVEREHTRGAIWCVSGNFYSELGILPLHGRALTPDDVDTTTLQPAPVAVIGYTFWQRHYGGDPAAIGRTIQVEDEPFTIVGVAPKGFTGLGHAIEPDITVPLTAFPIISHVPALSPTSGTTFWVRITGRLRPGVSISQARAAIEAMWPALKADVVPSPYVGAQRDQFLATRIFVASAATGSEQRLREKFTQPLVVLLGVAALVLLVACINLASLMFARIAGRRHEIGVRLALGAGRWRVARQMLVEGVLLSATGAVCGIWVAYVISHALMTRIFSDYLVPASLDVTPDHRLLVFSAALAIAAGILCSSAPAWGASRQGASHLLQRNVRTIAGTGRTGHLLVGTQIALSLTLLTNAGLLVRTLQEIRAVDSGLRIDDVLVAYPTPRAGGYRNVDNDSYYPRVIERLRAVAGVSSAAISLFKPGVGVVTARERVSPASSPSGAVGTVSLFMPVSPGFFDTLGIELTHGRAFLWGDNSRGRRVAIISETLARQIVPAGDAIGQHIRVGVLPRRQDVEIIGVATDAHVIDAKDPNLSAVYVPALQEADRADWKCFVIRGKSASLAEINRTLDSFGYERINDLQTLAYVTDRAVLQERITAALAAFLGGFALLLGAIGLYGLMSYEITQRRREIGIRLALGAEPAGIRRAVLRDGLALTLAGVAVGFAGALGTTQLVKSLLFGVSAHDWITLVGAPVILIGVATVACLLPAQRASRVDPMIALRAE